MTPVIGAAQWDGSTAPSDVRCISASSLGKALAAPALERWGLRKTINAAVDHSAWVAQSVAGGQGEAAKSWLWRARYETPYPFSATHAGSAVHAWLEHGLLGREIPAEYLPTLGHPLVVAMCQRLYELVTQIDLRILQMEQVVFDPDLRVAGRFDMKAEVNVSLGPGVIDLKTSLDARTDRGHHKRPYADSHGLQLAALAGAPLEATFGPRIVKLENDKGRYYLLNDAERAACKPALAVGWAAVLQVTPERAALYSVDIAAARPVVAAAVAAHDWLSMGASRAIPKNPLAVVTATTTQEAA